MKLPLSSLTFAGILFASLALTSPLEAQNPFKGKKNPFKKTQPDLEVRIGENRLRFEERQLRRGEAIPPRVIAQARGIVILHHVKVGMGFGAELGNGVAVVKDTNGNWGPPAFVTLSKGSWGAQIGANEAVTIMVLMNEDGLRILRDGGAGDAGVELNAVAGPMETGGEAGTISLREPVLIYSSAKGAFIGASFEAGALIGARNKNQTLYGTTSDQILFSGRVKPTPAGWKLIESLNKHSR